MAAPGTEVPLVKRMQERVGRLVACAVFVLGCWSVCVGQQTVLVQDTVGDAAIRRADPGADGPVDPVSHVPPDIVSYEIGAWEPTDPYDDRFVGTWSVSGGFLRFDIVFDGVVSPPGTLGVESSFEPFEYGPNPVFGYVEIDMDADVSTGGELDSPELRYLGTVARYGGLPTQAWFAGRAAVDDTAFDGNLATPPEVDRSGEEFHLVFYGWEITEIQVASGNQDFIFEAGEIWEVDGNLFHRAHGYEPFSYACCGGNPGGYEPLVQLLWSHSIGTDQTTVTLVYPLTNAASAAMKGDEDAEPNDGETGNQNSILEALDDLWFSASNPCCGWTGDPNWPIIAGWATKDPNQYLDPLTWRVNALVATSYTAQDPSGTLFVWTDHSADVTAGDFDASGSVDQTDVTLFDSFLSSNDGVVGVDEDGIVNGTIDLVNFGPNFSLYDVNYDGLVDAADRPAPQFPADLDGDGDVDVTDFLTFSSCFNGSLNPPQAGCPNPDADLDGDGDVDVTDFLTFASCFNGSLNPPTCP